MKGISQIIQGLKNNDLLEIKLGRLRELHLTDSLASPTSTYRKGASNL